MMTEQEHSNVQWRKVKLEEVGEINPSNKEPIPNQFIYIDLESVVAGKLLVENYILKENAPSRAQRLVYNNDVLYQTVRPYQRNNYIHKNQGNYVASTGYALIRCYDDYEPDFVYYLLHTHNFESIVLGLCTGTSYPAIAPNNLKRIKISIPFKNDKPDLSTQHRIAAILASADKVIASTQKLIAKYKQIKQGMMEELFNEQCTMNNVQWRKVRLGEIGDFYVGGDVDKNCFSPYPTMECKYPIYANALVNEGLYGYSSKYGFDKEAVTITGRGDVGKVFYRKPYFTTIIRLVTLIPTDPNIDVKFLSYAMSKINFIIESTGVPQLTAPQAKKYEVSVPYKNGKPDLTEQRSIASILSGIDAKIAAEEKVLEKYGKVKKGLMERLLNE